MVRFHIRVRSMLISWTVLIITVLYSEKVLGDFEVCNPRDTKAVYRFTKSNCPFGVFFYHPITAGCLASTNSEGHFISDLCEPQNYTIKARDDASADPYKIHLAFIMDEEPIDDQSSCSGIGNNKCNTTDVVEVTLTSFTEPIGASCDYDDEEAELSDEEKEKRNVNDPQFIQVFNQTERMFKYMLGLTTAENEDYSDTRLMKLLKQTFRILGAFCDTRYVPVDFGSDVLKAFTFLFRESDLTGFKDISVDSFEEIKVVLEQCERAVPKFNIIGNSCKTCPNVYSIQMASQSMRYFPNEFSFVWGKHDVPIDATWSAIGFVHGFCYETYKRNINFHHHYQTEMERLFTKEIIKRWYNPVILTHESLWDHLFSSNIKNTMRNLDACIQGGYFGTPFKHPLERQTVFSGSGSETGTAPAPSPPAEPATAPAGPVRRRKRSLPTMTLEDGGLQQAGWCFQTEEDLLKTTEAYVNAHCPNNRNALDEVKEIVNCVAAAAEEEQPPQATTAGPQENAN